VSNTEVTSAAAWIVGLAILAMVAAGWRKPARVTADRARARLPQLARRGVAMEELQAPLYRGAPWWKRLWSIVAGSAMGLVLGGVLATVVGAGSAFVVIALTRMLKQ
jgi:hypothetical protein